MMSLLSVAETLGIRVRPLSYDLTRVGRELKHSRTTLLGIFPLKGLVLAHSRPFEDERNPTCRKSMVRRCVLSTGLKFTFIVKDWQVPSIADLQGY